MSTIVWHDVECGGYRADLPLWRELAAAEAGPVLDVGAGAGRVALDLARAGHDVTALDRDAELLAELKARAAREGLEVRTEQADAAGFALPGPPFGLIVVPMQTIQLLPGRAARAAFFASAREHLASGGLAALAVAEALEPFEVDIAHPLPPDTAERDGWRYHSFPVAIRRRGDGVVLERVRVLTAPDGTSSSEDDAVALTTLGASDLEAEGRACGLAPEPARLIAETDTHLGSTVVLLRG
ncbi:MAG TPA: class I SAM-dependent methyltransferase [Solirubrobacteraceae bacterium]|nr:class I SAM-dependent methyltransferase [Solirubrobacteraceae bacterium]